MRFHAEAQSFYEAFFSSVLATTMLTSVLLVDALEIVLRIQRFTGLGPAVQCKIRALISKSKTWRMGERGDKKTGKGPEIEIEKT